MKMKFTPDFVSISIVVVAALAFESACAAATAAGKQTPTSTFLAKTCSAAQDCYLLPGVLELACYHNVGLCNCQLTISSIHRVESVNGACLMSKFGPCGSNDSGLVVGCMDGFACIENQCRDPASASTPKTPIKYESPFVFDRPCSDSESDPLPGASGCQFNNGDSDGLRFTCNYELGRCQCEEVELADSQSPVWDLRNFDGVHNCSVGKYGPCGVRDGIEVTCHGQSHGGGAIECVRGRCADSSHPLASVNEACGLVSDCESGLICSAAVGWSCIKPMSIGKGAACGGDEECQPGLRCKSFGFGWTSSCI